MESHFRETPFNTTHASLLADDYVSPNLRVVMPDKCFPQMQRGNMEYDRFLFFLVWALFHGLLNKSIKHRV